MHFDDCVDMYVTGVCSWNGWSLQIVEYVMTIMAVDEWMMRFCAAVENEDEGRCDMDVAMKAFGCCRIEMRHVIKKWYNTHPSHERK